VGCVCCMRGGGGGFFYLSLPPPRGGGGGGGGGQRGGTRLTGYYEKQPRKSLRTGLLHKIVQQLFFGDYATG